MAMTPAERQQRFRDKAKAEGRVRRELMLPLRVDEGLERLAAERDTDVSEVAAELLAAALKRRKG